MRSALTLRYALGDLLPVDRIGGPLGPRGPSAPASWTAVFSAPDDVVVTLVSGPAFAGDAAIRGDAAGQITGYQVQINGQGWIALSGLAGPWTVDGLAPGANAVLFRALGTGGRPGFSGFALVDRPVEAAEGWLWAGGDSIVWLDGAEIALVEVQ